MPGYARRRRKYPEPEAYLGAVLDKQLRDPVINFQVNQGYQVKGVLHDYLPSDRESGGHAVLMLWENPLAPPREEAGKRSRGPAPDRLPASVRVATVQLQMRGIDPTERLAEQVEYYVAYAAYPPAGFDVFY